MNHTPGPWTIAEIKQGPRGAAGMWLVRSGNLKLLLYLPHGSEENEANAHLIAKAPELLEALISLVRHDRAQDTREGLEGCAELQEAEYLLAELTTKETT